MTDVKNSDVPEWAKKPFASEGEIMEAMSDPRYKSHIYGDAFRNAVVAKLALEGSAQAGYIGHTDLRNTVQVTSSDSTDTAGIAAGFTRGADAPTDALTAEDIQAANDQAREAWGKDSFEPGSARITPKAS